MKNPRCCEHTEENAGPCLRCRQPMMPRSVKFVGSKREWLLLYRGQLLQRVISLISMVDIMKHISDEDERHFMIMCPNGVKISVDLARMLVV